MKKDVAGVCPGAAALQGRVGRGGGVYNRHSCIFPPQKGRAGRRFRLQHEPITPLPAVVGCVCVWGGGARCYHTDQSICVE